MGAVVTRGIRRFGAPLGALLLVTTACGEAKDDPAPGTIGSTLTTTPGVDPTASGPSGATSTTRRGAPPATTKGGGNSGSPTTADDGDLRAAARAAPGAFAGLLLAPGPADALVLDVLVQPGVTADSATVSAVRELLARTSSKSVTVRGPVELNTASDVHDADAIRRLADAQGRAQGNGTAVVHLLYLRGEFTDESSLGVAVRGDTFAIFPEQIAGASSPFASRARIERAVVTHELGHILGLVDIYLNTNRDDAEHPGHSTNPGSVMYWAVESDLIGQVLGGPPPIDFDGADQNDLRRICEGTPPAR